MKMVKVNNKRKVQEDNDKQVSQQPQKKLRKLEEKVEEEETYDSSDDEIQATEESTDSKLNTTDGYDDFGLGSVKWDSKQLDEFTKNLYKEHKQIASLSEEQVKQFRTKNEIRVIGEDVPNPIAEFKQISDNFPEPVMQTIAGLKFERPTPIQSQAWPIILGGNDMIGLAETGSGKTLAFLLPALAHLLEQRPVEKGDGPVVLVLAPTRELAIQIQTESNKYGLNTFQTEKKKKYAVKSACIYGGENRRKQITELKQYPQIVIATPGRLLDFLQAKMTNLNRVTYLVLDEADRMLDMGFAPQINQILSQIRPDRQTVMFSATWSAVVQDLAQNHLNSPYIVNIGAVGMSANRNVHQDFMFIQESDKSARLLNLMDEIMDGEKILIFAMTKNKADFITGKLRDEGWPALSIHGSRSQKERDWVISEFRSGQIPVLVATDVAARGLDINDIKCVINYDLPRDVDIYVHRIGRTGRAQKKGRSISFFTPDNVPLCNSLIQLLKKSKHTVPPQLEKLSKLSQQQHQNQYDDDDDEEE
jgi:superfamily II DNA/RNA helicase